jgi:hypothetical protein
MIHSFEIPQGGVNALFDSGTRSAVIAPGRFETTCDRLSDFLKTYPGVVCAGNREDIVVRPTFGQFGPRPPQVKVTRSGVDWASVKGKTGGR